MKKLPELSSDINYSLLTEDEKGNYDIAIKYFKKFGKEILSAPKHIMENKDCVIAAVSNSPWLLNSLDKKWSADRDVVLAALEKGDKISCISPELMSDAHVVAKVFMNRNHEKWPSELLLNDEVVKAMDGFVNQKSNWNTNSMVAEISKIITLEQLKEKHPYIYSEVIKTMKEDMMISDIYMFSSSDFQRNEDVCNAMVTNPIWSGLIGENIITYLLEKGHPSLRANKEVLLKYSIRDTDFGMIGLIDKNLIKDTDFLLNMLEQYLHIPNLGDSDLSNGRVLMCASIDALMGNQLFEKALIKLVSNIFGNDNVYQYKPSFLREFIKNDDKLQVHVGQDLPSDFHILLEKYISELLMKDDIVDFEIKAVNNHKLNKF